jgi:Zn/Cd-binding protein ZinT
MYKYYHYGYDQDVAAQIVTGHIMAFFENFMNTIYKNS